MTSMRKSRLSYATQNRLIDHFVAGATARTAAGLCGVNRVTVIYFFRRLRQIVELETTPGDQDLFGGEVEVDESYFGGRRKGKRGRGAAGKTPVFGVLKRGGKVYAQVIPNARTRTLKPIIQARVKPDSIVYTDSLRSYDALDVSEFHHVRINHSKRFTDGHAHINGIENFWNQAKRHLRQYNGIPREHFGLFLKECEWRFNNSDPNARKRQLKQWVAKHLR